VNPVVPTRAETASDLLRLASRSLADLAERDERARALIDDSHLPERKAYEKVIGDACAADGLAGLRLEKRRRLLQIAVNDLTGEASFERVGRALSDLADACIGAALDFVGAAGELCVIAMGKLGGRELNYASDIDIMFVSHADAPNVLSAAEALLESLQGFAPEGQAYRVDVDLRPEGRSGALVRSHDGCLEYYGRWAQPWEFQALIKARPAAGRISVGRSLLQGVEQLIYPPAVSSDRIAGIRAMKERLERHVAERALRGRSGGSEDVKLGPGGIRDIEFSVQLLQLVHGGADPSVRSATTLTALSALVDGGYIAEDDGASLSSAYRWLRTVEHRLQLWGERQVHRLPAGDDDRARLARVLGFRDSPSAGALERFERRHKAVLSDVRSRFEKLFYRPMIESLAEASPHPLSADAIRERLRVLGFRDAERSARTLSKLVSGTSRRARLFRVLSPAMLRFLASSPVPDEGLFSFLRLGEALEERIDALGALRDNPAGLAFLARALGSGRVIGDVLAHVPDEITVIAQGSNRTRLPPEEDRKRLVHEAMVSLEWRQPERRLDGLRRFKRRAMLEIALDDLIGILDDDGVGIALANLADACLEAALSEAHEEFAVIGMGKLGGRELNYASDIDVMFVHDGDSSSAEKLAESLLKSIGEVTREGSAFRIDARLRPEGNSGPLARSLRSFIEYYERWSRPWQYQALLKARPVAGSEALGREFVERTRRWAWPKRLGQEALAEVRHLKARMEKERIARGTDPRRNFKLGPGGASDIEFSAQILQLMHAHRHEALRVTGTVETIEAARDAELITPQDADQLVRAYRFIAHLRNRLFFMAGKPVDALPVQPERLEALGVAMGFEEQPRQELEEQYLRITRRTRRVSERLIYG
jgi:[glutamine synthetase] adenylyltransferase / [glutamine synthetase]-adenylyl-L-tyrosine phosphorylase